MSAFPRFALCVALCSFSFPLQAHPAPAASVITEDVKQAAQKYLDTQDISGLTVIYLEKGHTPTLLSLGYTSLETDPNNRFPISAASRYEIGSLTKLFTGLLAAHCVEQGRCTPQDPLSKHLPKDTLSQALKPVTLKQLLTHTSGLPALPHNIDPAQPNDPYADYGHSQFKDYLALASLNEAGQYRYSNIGFGILGYVFAQNRPLQKVLAQQILQPLRMGSTSFEDLENRKLSPVPHHLGEPTSPWHFQDTTAGAGALRSSGEDMAKFLSAQMFPQQISSPDLKRAIVRSQQVLVSQDQLGQPFDMSYAWHKMKVKNTVIYTHNGQTGGFTSFIGFDDKRERGAVILSNGTAEIGSLGLALLVPDIQARGPQDLRLAPAQLQAYTGKYALAPGVIFTITQKNGYLYAQLTGQEAYRVYPVADKPHHFRYTVVDAMLVFKEDGKGLVLHQNGTHPAPRIE